MSLAEKSEILTPEQKAVDMAEHWERFVNGDEPAFQAYFFLEDGYHDHGVLRELFLGRIGVTDELDGPGPRDIYKNGLVKMSAFSNTSEGEPFDVSYLGVRVEPVQ